MKTKLKISILAMMLITVLALVSCSFKGCKLITGNKATTNLTTTTAHQHTVVIDEAVSPTCTESGLTEGKHCSDCGEVLLPQESVPATHTFGEPEIIANADCFNNGEQKLSCVNCEYEETQVIDKSEHEVALVEGTELNQCTLCGAYEFGGHFYKIFDIDTTWTGAKEHCENLGGHSVTITSQEENDFIYALMGMGTSAAYWLGGIRENDVWIWITGEEFAYTCWSSGEPNFYWGREYWLETYRNGTWNDTIITGENDANTGIICEWDSENKR